MSTLKLAITRSLQGVADIHDRRGEVDDALYLGMDKAQTLVSDDPHEWVSRILDRCGVAADQELAGLTEALECLVSSDERPADELVNERRPRG